MHRIFLLSLFLFNTAFVSAEIAGFPFESAAQEDRFRSLASELRCLVCQNQSLQDSNAGLAQDLRSELYKQVIKGNSEEQIVSFMTNRYGDFILYKPRVNKKTALLWTLPFIFLIVGIISLFRIGRNENKDMSEHEDDDELKKIRKLLENEAELK